MSEQKFEPCTLEEATHVEMGGELYILGHDYGNKQVLRRDSHNIEVSNTDAHWQHIHGQLIHVFAFPLLGIKTLKKVKPEPIEFEAVFAMSGGKWHPLYSLDEGFAYQNCKKVRLKCVEILEDKE